MWVAVGINPGMKDWVNIGNGNNKVEKGASFIDTYGYYAHTTNTAKDQWTLVRKNICNS